MYIICLWTFPQENFETLAKKNMKFSRLATAFDMRDTEEKG